MKFRSTTIRTLCISSILLIISLGIVFVVMRNQKPYFSSQVSPSPVTTTQLPDPLQDRCGLTLNTPAPSSMVSASFTVAGTLAMGSDQVCRWTVFEGIAGRIEVRSPATNELLAPVVPITLEGDWMEIALAGGMLDFAVPIALSSTYTGPATLLLIEDDPSGESEVINTVMVTVFIQ